MSVNPDSFEEFESDLNLFSTIVDGIPLWERIRFDTFRDIRLANGFGQAHTQTGDGLREHLRRILLLTRNTIYRNPFFADEHDYLFIGHQRRKLEEDGYWWDPYCDPIHESGEIDYVHLEYPHELSHRTPAKSQNLRYAEIIEYTASIQRKAGIRIPSLPEDVVLQFREAELAIDQRFNADVDLVSKAQTTLEVRNKTLPLYERLLDRIDPSVVVIVVSYGKETLIEACRRKDVPVVELQHGVVYDHHYGYSYPEDETKIMFPDYFFSFGEFWNDNAQFPIADEHVIPVGYPYLEARTEKYKRKDPNDQMLFISQGVIGQELSEFALAVNDDPRIGHDIVYKLHPGEYDRWQDEYHMLAESDITVIDEPEPSLYQLFAESSIQIGVGSTAVYEGLCFELETFVFDTEGSDILQPLVNDGAASMIANTDDLASLLTSSCHRQFDRSRFFQPDAVENILVELSQIKSTTN